MDSTTVRMITDAATTLGMKAGDLFGLYLLVKVVIHLIWAVMVGVILFKLVGLLTNVGRGQALLGLIMQLEGNSWVVSHNAYVKALRVLSENWKRGA